MTISIDTLISHQQYDQAKNLIHNNYGYSIQSLEKLSLIVTDITRRNLEDQNCQCKLSEAYNFALHMQKYAHQDGVKIVNKAFACVASAYEQKKEFSCAFTVMEKINKIEPLKKLLERWNDYIHNECPLQTRLIECLRYAPQAQKYNQVTYSF